MSDPLVVTIDGPAGVGKSTVGRLVASALNLPFLDTGIFYRAVTAAAAAAGMGPDDPARLAALAGKFELEVNTDPGANAWRARIAGRDLDLELWDPRLAVLLAQVASLAPVRQALLTRQRAAAQRGVVAVGRDTGSVVFPEARCKFYLDAPAEIRLERRRAELRRRGIPTPDELLLEEVVGRDRTDSTREHSPLAVPAGAILVDTSAIPAAEVAEAVLFHCHRICGN